MNDNDEPTKEIKAIFGGESTKTIWPEQANRHHHSDYQEEKKNLEIDKVRFQRVEQMERPEIPRPPMELKDRKR